MPEKPWGNGEMSCIPRSLENHGDGGLAESAACVDARGDVQTSRCRDETRSDVGRCLVKSDPAQIPSRDGEDGEAVRQPLRFKQSFLETQARIRACADTLNFHFHETSASELTALHDFWRTHLSPIPHQRFLKKVLEVKAIFAREFPKIEQLLAAIENLHERTSIESAADFQAAIKAAGDLITGIQYIDFVPGHVEKFFAMLREIWKKGECDTTDMLSLREAANILWGVWRYTVEDWKETYKSGRFSAEYFAGALGFENVEALFFREDGTRRTIVDLGCGDADLLRELARVERTLVRGEGLAEDAANLLLEEGLISKMPDAVLQRVVRKNIFEYLSSQGISIPSLHEPIDPHFIGVEQTGSAQRLCEPDIGISGRKADMCAPWETFQEQSKIEPGSVDVVNTTLTLDRAYSIENLFANMSTMLRPDGRFMIATKGLVKAESDGHGGKKYKIAYGGKVLTSKTYEGTLRKLQRELRKHGLEIDTVSCHPVQVISSDCYPNVPSTETNLRFVPPMHENSAPKKTADAAGQENDPALQRSSQGIPRIRPQEYNLLVVTGRKVGR